MIAEMWALWQPKDGNPEAEYEDACCYSEGYTATPRRGRRSPMAPAPPSRRSRG